MAAGFHRHCRVRPDPRVVYEVLCMGIVRGYSVDPATQLAKLRYGRLSAGRPLLGLPDAEIEVGMEGRMTKGP